MILWLTMVVLTALLFQFYIPRLQGKMEMGLDREEIEKDIRIPELKEELKNFPQFDIPTSSQEKIEEGLSVPELREILQGSPSLDSLKLPQTNGQE